MIKLVVGLGNPGRQYEGTRHNVGFWFVDELAFRFRADWRMNKRCNAQIAQIKISENDVMLMKPLTFMNNSGASVSACVCYHQLCAENVLVVHDELDFLPGIVRFKKGGGHAGHNGLRDIVARLGVNNFLRLRIGIGRPMGRQLVADFVLSSPNCDDRQVIRDAYEKILVKFDLLFENNLDRALSELHAKQ